MKKSLQPTPWKVNQEETEMLDSQLRKIKEAKHLNVEMAIRTASLKDDYKSAPVLNRCDLLGHNRQNRPTHPEEV